MDGRIAYHQQCLSYLSCSRENLSRKHAVLCSGVDDVLFGKYKEVESFQSQTILDTLLNYSTNTCLEITFQSGKMFLGQLIKSKNHFNIAQEFCIKNFVPALH